VWPSRVRLGTTNPNARAASEGEQVLSIRGKNVSITIRDISHPGIVLEQNSTLEAEGEIEGAGFSTVTIHIEPDGLSRYEQKGFVTTPKGELVTSGARAHGRPSVRPTRPGKER